MIQLLGKWDGPTRDLLCLQRGAAEGAEEEGRWDARSFSHKIVVPWVHENNFVLGTSSEPYGSKPLRRPRLDVQTEHLRNKKAWATLVTFLEALQKRSDPDVIDAYVKRCLMSVARLLAAMDIDYLVPLRISLENLCNLIKDYTEASSGGLRPLVITTAFMKTIGQAFSLWSRVESQGINEADVARGLPGDIMCHGEDDSLRLVTEVKDRTLTLTDVDSTVKKALLHGEASHLLFTAPGLAETDRKDIEEHIASA